MLASAPAEVKELLAETHRACNELQEVLQRLTSIDVYRTTNYLESSQSRDAPENKMLDI